MVDSRIRPGPVASRDLDLTDRFDRLGALPHGTTACALDLAGELALTVGAVSGRGAVVDRDATIARVFAPMILGDGEPGGPGALVETVDGHVHADVIEADRPTFRALHARFGSSAEDLASVAQRCRIPVTPYRSLAAVEAPSIRAVCSGDAAPTVDRPRDLVDATVVDLTSMWAGPLATGLLAAAGARVVKVTARKRPDGLRSQAELSRSLGRPTSTVELDLDVADDRRSFEALVRRADLVVESFSDRVMPNFGYGPSELRRLHPSIATLSIRAFAPGSPEESWIGYGGGVHASSGLGMWAREPSPSRFSYLDPLCGMTAARAGLELLSSIVPAEHVVCSLGEVAERLRSRGVRPRRPVGGGANPGLDAGSIRRLRAVADQPVWRWSS